MIDNTSIFIYYILRNGVSHNKVSHIYTTTASDLSTKSDITRFKEHMNNRSQRTGAFVRNSGSNEWTRIERNFEEVENYILEDYDDLSLFSNILNC